MIYPVRVYCSNGDLKREYTTLELVKRERDRFENELELPFPQSKDNSPYLNDSYKMYPSNVDYRLPKSQG